MTIHYNLYRFGVDEFAVGQLINGDVPTDDEERWRMHAMLPNITLRSFLMSIFARRLCCRAQGLRKTIRSFCAASPPVQA